MWNSDYFEWETKHGILTRSTLLPLLMSANQGCYPFRNADSHQTQALTLSTQVFQTCYQYFSQLGTGPWDTKFWRKGLFRFSVFLHKHELLHEYLKIPPSYFGDKDLVLQTKFITSCLKASVEQSAGFKIGRFWF